MDLGFETTGNATLVVHDGGPLLVTDPWLVGSAYFGSWGLSHLIPDEVMEHILACRYVWISHGHPDHLSFESLELLRGKPILLPDHRGGRIAKGLRDAGHEVRVLKDGEWVELTERTRICCIGDIFQDAILMVDIGGRLIIDSNDAGDRGAGEFVRAEVAKREESFLMALTGYGDADMINFLDESGDRQEPMAAAKEPPGPGIAGILDFTGIRTYVPFSTMHRYQRADSVWANEHTTGPEDFGREFPTGDKQIYPAFCRADFTRGEVTALDPEPAPDGVRAPGEFGDDWSEELGAEDIEKLKAYFGRVEHLKTFLGRLHFVVGGIEHTVDVAPGRFDRAITFRAPAGSLRTAIEYEVFDDMLIGNFMSTTLHGDWDARGELALYPDFTPFVCKFADNGCARTRDELRDYFRDYEARGFFGPGPTPMGAEIMGAVQPYLGR